MSLAPVATVPESARGYSLRANVMRALAAATIDGKVRPLILMDAFLAGLPARGDVARELSSQLGKGATEVPLFGSVFNVPLPITPVAIEFDGPVSGYEAIKALAMYDQLPNPYKTDVVVYDQADQGTLKVTAWHKDDPRGEIPHNHPWADEEGVSFISYIVRGGYKETRTKADGTTETRTLVAGDLNESRYDEFHTVSDILPGTLTILMCAPRAVVAQGNEPWGYLVFKDLEGNALTTGVLVGMNDPRTKDGAFIAKAAVQNPALRVPLKKMAPPVTGAALVAAGATPVPAVPKA
jgi:hypothetical protein